MAGDLYSNRQLVDLPRWSHLTLRLRRGQQRERSGRCWTSLAAACSAQEVIETSAKGFLPFPFLSQGKPIPTQIFLRLRTVLDTEQVSHPGKSLTQAGRRDRAP
jgi:hypothetical protein